MNSARVLAAAKDCLTQFLASRYPLKNVARDIIAIRKLNSRERRVLLDIVFRFSREAFLFEQFLADTIRFAKGMPTQEKNARALEVFAFLAGLFGSPDLAELAHNYEAYVQGLGRKRFLLMLSPFVRERLVKDHGEQADAIAEGMSERPAKYFAFDRQKLSANDVKRALTMLGITHFEHPLLPSAIGTHDDIDVKALPKTIRDHLWLMDAGSQIIAELINPQPSHRVLDMCAGEGNKARYITMHDCHYVAADIDGARLKRAKARLLDSKIDFVVADGRALPFAAESFDWILLDAPCSGTGVLRRHPDLMYRLTPKILNESLELQRDLLDSAIKLLKPDGILIYATCSLFAAENGQQIERCLSKNSRLKPCALKEIVGDRIMLDKDALCNNSHTLFPHFDDCDGFFFAALKKVTG